MMNKSTVIAALLIGNLQYGCAAVDEKDIDLTEGFIGETKEALIAALGEPKYSIDSTFDDAHASRTYIFPMNPKVGCVESYKIETESSRVIEYACR